MEDPFYSGVCCNAVMSDGVNTVRFNHSSKRPGRSPSTVLTKEMHAEKRAQRYARSIELL